MISTTIGTPVASNTSAVEPQDATSSTASASQESAGGTSFSSAMASAAGATPAPGAAGGEASTANTAGSGANATCDAPANATAGVAPSSSSDVAADGDGALARATACRTAASAARALRPAGSAVNGAKGRVPSSGSMAPEQIAQAKTAVRAQTSARSAPPTSTVGEQAPKAGAAAAPDAPGVQSANPTALPAAQDAACTVAAAASGADALASLSAAQVASAQASARGSAEANLAQGETAPKLGASAGAQGASAITPPGFSASGNSQAASPTNADVSCAASGLVAPSTPPSFSMLFGGAAKAGAERTDSNAPDAPINATAPGAGPNAGLSSAALTTLVGVSTHGAPAAAPSSSAVLNIATAVGEPGFGQDASRQIVYLAKTGVQSAQLSLQPADLGPVSVSIQMNGLQASLVISASHATTRAALQDALPHLSELFQSSGLQLTGAQVGDGSARNADQGPAQRNGLAANDPLGSVPAAHPTAIALAATTGAGGPGNRLIDTFA